MSAGRSTPSTSGVNTTNFVSRSGCTSQQLSCLLIQACGLLLAQLPLDFHSQLYMEASRLIKDSWWLTDGKRSKGELDSAVGYALLDPTWAAQDNTSTAIGTFIFCGYTNIHTYFLIYYMHINITIYMTAIHFSRSCCYKENNDERVHGGFCYGARNEGEETILDFVTLHDLVSANTFRKEG